MRRMKMRVTTLAITCLITLSLPARERTIDDFFNDFTGRWVQGNPNQATASRYFTGSKQDQLERQLTPESLAYRQERIQLARQGLNELAKFDRDRPRIPSRLNTGTVPLDILERQVDAYIHMP